MTKVYAKTKKAEFGRSLAPHEMCPSLKTFPKPELWKCFHTNHTHSSGLVECGSVFEI